MKIISVVGCGLSLDDLTQRHMKIISEADLLVGGRRLLSFFADIPAETHAITKDIKSTIELIKKRMVNEKVVVLASGDPMFYGIGSTLVREIGKAHVKVYSNISSVSAAFAAINEPWEDAKTLSLHGRPCMDLNGVLAWENKIAFLTDGVYTPAWLARQLLNMESLCFAMHVFERLGGPDEKRMFFDDMRVPAEMKFSMPNVVILLRLPEHCSSKVETCSRTEGMERYQASTQNIENKSLSLLSESDNFGEIGNKMTELKKDRFFKHHAIYPGMPTNLFVHENALITKAEVRSVVISKLRLVSACHTFWDLGSGSGSVAIEVSRFLDNGVIFAVEKNENRIVQIQQNMKKFGVSNIRVIHARLPQGMEILPEPHRIFIGGGGADLPEIIKAAAERLSIGGIIVINTVLLQTMEMARDLLPAMGFATELIQLQVSVSKQMPFGERLEALNPVWIITGEKI